MSIEFEDEKINSQNVVDNFPIEQKTGSKIGDFIIRVGLAKNANSANIILIISTILIFAISIYFFIYGFALPPKKQAPTRDFFLENLQNLEQEQNI